MKFFKAPQISSIFHFDRKSDGRMVHILGVNEYNLPLGCNWVKVKYVAAKKDSGANPIRPHTFRRAWAL